MPKPNRASLGQDDLFTYDGWQPDPLIEEVVSVRLENPRSLDDAALLAAIPYVSRTDCDPVVKEVLRRKLRSAIPLLEDLCRRFKGYGRTSRIHEQIVSLEALSTLAGPEASDAVLRMITEQVIDGPAVRDALAAAVSLKTKLPSDLVILYLRHPDPNVRALACRAARFCPQAEAILIELLDDLHPEVIEAAAIMLGRMGNPIARPPLLTILVRTPSKDIVTALAEVVDDDTFVLLGRLAAARPNEFRDHVIETLDQSDHPRARAILERLSQDKNCEGAGTCPSHE